TPPGLLTTPASAGAVTARTDACKAGPIDTDRSVAMSFPPDCYVLGLEEIDQTQVAVVGGKGGQLGGVSGSEGIHVPPGFCVTTDAFRRVMADAPSINDRLDQLSRR